MLGARSDPIRQRQREALRHAPHPHSVAQPSSHSLCLGLSGPRFSPRGVGQRFTNRRLELVAFVSKALGVATQGAILAEPLGLALKPI